MGKVESIEQQVASLTPDELASFRAWFASFDADAWDAQIAADANAGRFDALAEAAIRAREIDAGKVKVVTAAELERRVQRHFGKGGFRLPPE